jgi:hypothetical protein
MPNRTLMITAVIVLLLGFGAYLYLMNEAEKAREVVPSPEATRKTVKSPDELPIPSETWKGEGVVLEVGYTAFGSFDEATAALPAGSVDAMITDFTSPIRREILIEVTAKPETGKTPPTSFETTLYLRSGRIIHKIWSAAKGNTRGSYKALITAPGIVERAETRVTNPELPADPLR